jgi:hypothetical protein
VNTNGDTTTSSRIEWLDIKLVERRVLDPTLLQIPLKSIEPFYDLDHDKLIHFAKHYQPRTKYCFDVDLTSWAPKGVYCPSAIIYRSKRFIDYHFDGKMSGSILTLVVGTKIWKLKSPSSRIVYSMIQNSGETIYVPAGYQHSVDTVTDYSIAYGCMWKSSSNSQNELICQNREFIKTMNLDMKAGFLDEFSDFPNLHKRTRQNSVLQGAGKRFAIKKGGSTRRQRDGDRRIKKHLTFHLKH